MEEIMHGVEIPNVLLALVLSALAAADQSLTRNSGHHVTPWQDVV